MPGSGPDGGPARPLFVTRKFPPSVGGMETLAAGVWRSLAAAAPGASCLALGRSNRNLVWWVPLTLARLLPRLVGRRRSDLVLTGDALMWALTAPMLRLFRVPGATMIMGLDVTFEQRLYRTIVHRALRRCPRVLAISTATAERAVEFGVAPERVRVVRLGVPAATVTPEVRAAARRGLRERAGLAPDAVVVVTLGRLVRRKGVRWFTTTVLPQLPGVHYVVAGDGEDRAAIAAAAAEHGVSDRLHLLGQVPDDVRELVLVGGDVFLAPNVPVDGDMEGFGLVTIEAAMRGTPVVAADLEGIKDAVVDGVTGTLLPPADGAAWVAVLTRLLADPAALAETGRTAGEQAPARYGEAAMGAELRAALSAGESSGGSGAAAG